MTLKYLQNIKHDGPVTSCVYFLYMLATGERIRIIWGVDQKEGLMLGPCPDEETTGDIEQVKKLFGIDVQHIDIPASAFLLDGTPCRIREYYMPATFANLTKSYCALKEYGFKDGNGNAMNLPGEPI
ncbi:MAG: hypothetical protein ACJA1I_001072 [Zhongshania marina]|jgi:hypothetical protein